MFTSSAKKAIVSALFVATTLSASSVAMAQSQRMKLEIAPSDTVCFRLYNPWSREHLFTSDRQELITLNRLGWRWEGVSWKDEGDTVVYRLYNPYVSGGDHHYTTSKQEVDECLAQGWKLDSSTKLSVSDIKREGLVPVYRLYNPYEQEHYHHFTADKDEQQHLISLGWRDEGVAWWAKPVQLVQKGDVYRVEGSVSQGQTIELNTNTDTSTSTSSHEGDVDQQTNDPNMRQFMAELRTEFHRLVNEHRVNHGVNPVAYNSELNDYANTRALELTQRFEHIRPDGTTPNSGIPSSIAHIYGCENAYMSVGSRINRIQWTKEGADALALDLFTSWKNSPGHNRWMLFEKHQSHALGITLAKDTEGRFIGIYAADFYIM